MFDYLQKFNSLPSDLRNKVSSSSAMAVILDLENKYKVDLAMTIMKVMIKGVDARDLPSYFISEFGLARDAAENLSRELKEKVFFGVADYLGLSAELRAFDLDNDLQQLIKEAGLMFPSENLVLRFKNIIGTYVKGIRNKIDTRNSLAKDVKIGGLNLSAAEIDRVLKVCDAGKFSVVKTVQTPVAEKSPAVTTSLDRLIAADTAARASEYDLKSAILSGQVKAPQKEISGPDKQLDLPIPTPSVKPEIPKAAILTPAQAIKSAPLPPLKPAVKPAIPTKPAGVVRPAKKSSFWSNFSFGKKKKNIVAPKAVSKAVPKVVPTAVLKPVTKVAPIQAPIQAPIVPPRPNIVSPAALRPATSVSSGRPQMHDVRPVPRVMGPVEELQFLDLVNFRRLGKTPVEITTKIFAKVKLLEKDGYDKMVAGVKAWRQSPVYRLYLRLGQEALVKGVTLKEAIEIRQKAGQDYLSPEEIVAIVNLNSKLVF